MQTSVDDAKEAVATQRWLTRWVIHRVRGEASPTLRAVLDQLEQGTERWDVRKEPVDVVELLHRAAAEVTAHAGGVEVVVSTPLDACSRYVGDGPQLEVVLRLLLDDALERTTSGHIGMRLIPIGQHELDIEVRDTSGSLQLSDVRSFEQAAAAVEPHHPASASACRHAAAHQVVVRLRGSLSWSTGPAGPIARVRLPMAQHGRARPIALHSEVTALLVIAESGLREVCEQALLDRSMKVKAVGTLVEAKAWLAENGPVQAWVADGRIPQVIELQREAGLRGAKTVWLNPVGQSLAPEQALLWGVHHQAHRPVRVEHLIDKLAEAGETAPRQRRDGRVLVVDDEAQVRHRARQLLQAMGYEVSEARHGREAVQAAADTPFVAVLLDCEMPHQDGFTTAKHLRAVLGNRAPVVIGLSDGRSGLRERALASGMDACVTKPLVGEAIQMALATSLAGR